MAFVSPPPPLTLQVAIDGGGGGAPYFPAGPPALPPAVPAISGALFHCPGHGCSCTFASSRAARQHWNVHHASFGTQPFQVPASWQRGDRVAPEVVIQCARAVEAFPVHRLDDQECAKLDAEQCPACYYVCCRGHMKNHHNCKSCAYRAAIHEAVASRSSQPGQQGVPATSTSGDSTGLSNWDVGRPWLLSLDMPSLAVSPNGRGTLDEFPHHSCVPLFSQCLSAAIAFYPDDLEAGSRLILLLPRMLLTPVPAEVLDEVSPSQSLGRARGITAVVKDRCTRFLQNSRNWEGLLLEGLNNLAATQRTPSSAPSASQPVSLRQARKAAKLVQKGQPGRGLRILGASGVADLSRPAVIQKLRDLHPSAEDEYLSYPWSSNPPPSDDDTDDTIDLSTDSFLDTFGSLQEGKAADIWGWRYEYVESLARNSPRDARGLDK